MTSSNQNTGPALLPRTTFYNGIRMRSRLEARYASWLDGHSTPWRYEPACFAGPGGQYLPDFEIMRADLTRACYVELKPTPAAAAQALDRMHLIRSTVADAVLLVVTPRPGREDLFQIAAGCHLQVRPQGASVWNCPCYIGQGRLFVAA